MKKRINNEYPPLHLLKTVTALRPLAWEQMKDFHDHNGRDGLSHWPEWCYAPIAAAIAVATEGAPITPQNREYFFNSMKLAQQIAALAGWEIATTMDILAVYVPLDEHMASAAIRAWAEAGRTQDPSIRHSRFAVFVSETDPSALHRMASSAPRSLAQFPAVRWNR